MPGSDSVLGSADYSIAPSKSDAVVLTATDAAELKGVFLELAYDPSMGQPQLLSLSPEFAGNVSLLHEIEPGLAHLGLVLTNHQDREGVTGTFALAEIGFDEHAETPIPVQPKDTSAVSVLTAAFPRVDRATKRLTWAYQLKGDYDQNGEVNINDLTPLAREFGSVGPFDFHTAKSVVDGDGNGAITISDITPIALSYGKRVEEIQLEGFDNQGGYQTAAFSMADVVGDSTTERHWLDVTFDDMRRGYYYSLGLVVDGLQITGSGMAGPGIYGVDEPDLFTPEYYDDDFGLSYSPESGNMIWAQYLRGDSNQDGTVLLSDLTAMGANLGKAGPWPIGSTGWLADANQDLFVSIADINIIRLRMHVTVDSVDAYYSTEGPPPDRFADYGEPLAGTPPSGSWVWVRPKLGEFIGPACGIQQIP